MSSNASECRAGCGACCIVISIAGPISGMPNGKPAGVRCVNLTENNFCTLFGMPQRPAVCSSLQPMKDMCGESNEEAYTLLSVMEIQTDPHIS